MDNEVDISRRNRGTRGLTGKDGKQGPRGEPSKECSCMYKDHTPKARYITSGGSRTLSETDSEVIISTTKECVLLLPTLIFPPLSSKDHYYPRIYIKIFNTKGIHKIVSEGHKINEFCTCVTLEKRKIYNFISCPEGWIMI